MRFPLTADALSRPGAILLAVCLAVLPVMAQETAPTASPASPEAVAPAAPAAAGAAPEAHVDHGAPPSAPAAETQPQMAPSSPAPATAQPVGEAATTPELPAASTSPSPEPLAHDSTAPAGMDAAPGAPQPGAPALTPETNPAAANGQGGIPVPPMENAATAPAPAPAAKTGPLPHDLSPWGMFQQADIVVKGVMIGLAFASFVTWTVWLAKAFELAVARRRLRRAYRSIRAAPSLSDAVGAVAKLRGTGPYLVREAAEEMHASEALLDRGDASGIKERVTSRLSRAEADAGRRLTIGTGVLATIGATAPFVGLFGTVWGIMNSFIGISEAQTTNLAVVAPGIAEALLATAIGLVAAIPAVIIYNVFARSIAGYRLELANTSAVVERLVSRDLDLRRLSIKPAQMSYAAE